jgi:hypothetical protein
MTLPAQWHRIHVDQAVLRLLNGAAAPGSSKVITHGPFPRRASAAG